jgi:hypothetical protein
LNYLQEILPLKAPLIMGFETSTLTRSKGESGLRGHLFFFRRDSKKWIGVNDSMLIQGWVVAHGVSPFTVKHKAYLKLMSRAIESGNGIFNKALWKGSPYAFRVGIDGKARYWIGDVVTKKLFGPYDFKRVRLDQRIFFENLEQAFKAGYRP